MEEEKFDLSLKETIDTVWWNVKQAFSVSRLSYSMILISKIVLAITPILVPLIGAEILNEIIKLVSNDSKEISDRLMFLIITSALIVLISGIFFNIYRYFTRKWRFYWDYVMWTRFIQKTSELDFDEIESPHYKVFQHKAKEGVDWRGRDVSVNFAELIHLLTALVLGLALFAQLNFLIILVLAIPGILNLLINKKFGKVLYSFWGTHGEVKTNSWYSQHALEDKDVLRESKIYGFTNHILERFASAQLAFIAEASISIKGRYTLNSLVVVLETIISIGIQIFLISQLFNGTLTIGLYVFYVMIVGRMTDLLERFEEATSGIIDDLRYSYNLRKFFELKSKFNNPNDKKFKVEDKLPEIEFKNVSFKYPTSEDYILKNVSFKIQAGDKVSLVGENGAGKTTIIKLLARFYDVDEGEILINGVNIKEVDLGSYYKLWGVLFQHFAKFWFTVRENIGVGNMEDINNLELIKEAAEKSGAAKYISKLPNEYETMLSNDFKDGVDPSGGQWQKLGIARGLFANPKLIVLDEPTSALDAIAEAQVFAELKTIAKDTTMLIVSHRFATVRNADRILVLENGEISEQGSHEELMKHKGLYHKMFTTQSEGYR